MRTPSPAAYLRSTPSPRSGQAGSFPFPPGEETEVRRGSRLRISCAFGVRSWRSWTRPPPVPTRTGLPGRDEGQRRYPRAGDASSHAVRAGGEMRRPLALALALACAAGLVAGSTASELTFENASIGGLTATEKLFRGAVATNDGRITLVPSHAESIVIFDENAESFATVNTGTAANDKYCGGARVSDGGIVFAPFLGRSRVGGVRPEHGYLFRRGHGFPPRVVVHGCGGHA